MVRVELPLRSMSSSKPDRTVILFLSHSSNIAITSDPDDPKMSRLQDGLHNNGGWHIQLTPTNLANLISRAFEVPC